MNQNIDDSSAGNAVIIEADDPSDMLARLLADPHITVIDTCRRQPEALRELTPAPEADVLDEPTLWAYYPWRRSVVHILGPMGFRRLRFNRNLISAEEDRRLARLRVGVIGLSVGNAIAYALAAEGLRSGRVRFDYGTALDEVTDPFTRRTNPSAPLSATEEPPAPTDAAGIIAVAASHAPSDVGFRGSAVALGAAMFTRVAAAFETRCDLARSGSDRPGAGHPPPTGGDGPTGRLGRRLCTRRRYLRAGDIKLGRWGTEPTARRLRPADSVGLALREAQQHGIAIQPVSSMFLYAHSDEDCRQLFRAPTGALRDLQYAFRQLTATEHDEHQALVLRLFFAPRPPVRSRRRPLPLVHELIHG